MALIIIGCDSGLGFSLALYCRSLGFTVIATVLKRDNPNVKELHQASIHINKLDITKQQSVNKFAIDVQELLRKEELGKKTNFLNL